MRKNNPQIGFQGSIQKLCKIYGISLQRSFGQNFLTSEDILKTIVDSANISQDDTVLEIGPGFGTLTALLAARAKKVIAVELEKRFIPILQAELAKFKNVEIIQGDILRFQVSRFKFQEYKIVANLPYNITSHFLRKFLSGKPRPELMVLLVQKEVAERMVSMPGAMSMLSVSVQWYSRPEILGYVPRENFYPAPEVDSAIVRIISSSDDERTKRLMEAGISEETFFRIAKFGFASKRKQLHNNLSGGLKSLTGKTVSKEAWKKIFQEACISQNARAQELSQEQWMELLKILKKYKSLTGITE